MEANSGDRGSGVVAGGIDPRDLQRARHGEHIQAKTKCIHSQARRPGLASHSDSRLHPTLERTDSVAYPESVCDASRRFSEPDLTSLLVSRRRLRLLAPCLVRMVLSGFLSGTGLEWGMPTLSRSIWMETVSR